jgi:hypothetical protein
MSEALLRNLVCPSNKEVEQCDDSTLELGTYRTLSAMRLIAKTVERRHTAARVDSGGAQSLPNDALTDVRGDEQRDARAEAVAFLQQLVLLCVNGATVKNKL